MRVQLQSSRQIQRFKQPLLVKATLTLHGKTYSTYISQGATADDLIAKIARENGGGVAKVYYKEFNAFEIVAVKIGDQLLVKGDRKRVAEADYSNFKDPKFVRKAAIAASGMADGGIHFFVGSHGIPIAMDKSENLVFPNADELKIGKNIRDLSIGVVSNNADPKKLDDLKAQYSGMKMTKSAATRIGRDEFEKAHGGFRSNKLMLSESSVIILERDTGEIRSAEERRNSPIDFSAPKITLAPAYFQKNPEVPQRFVETPGMVFNTDLGSMVIPMDGSSVKVPYLYIRKFDCQARDYFKVQFEPAEEIIPVSSSLKDQIMENFKEDKPRKEKAPEKLKEPQESKKAPDKKEPSQNPKTVEKAPEKTGQVRTKKQKESRKKTLRPKTNDPKVTPKKADKKAPRQKEKAKKSKASKPKTIRTEKKTEVPKKKAEPAKTARKKKIKIATTAKKSKPAVKKPKKKAEPKASNTKKPKAAPKKVPKAAKEKKPKAIAREIPKVKDRTKKKPRSAPKPIEKKTKSRRAEKIHPAKPVETKTPEKFVQKTATQEKIDKEKRKKVSSYYLNSMLGLLRSKKPGKKVQDEKD